MLDAILVLGGLGALAFFLQQKPLPSQEDALKALETLDSNPDDADANTVAGKYKAFVMGDYAEGIPYLKKSKDVTLKTIADHETDPSYTTLPDNKMKMGDEWVAATKKFPALSRIFYDRANQWYVEGWKGLEGIAKQRARLQALKISTSRPIGVPRKQLPTVWEVSPSVTVDGSIARLGSHSAKLAPANAQTGQASGATTTLLAVTGRMMEVVAFVRSDGTENAADRIFIFYFDQAGTGIGTKAAFIPLDTPFWNPVIIKDVVPPNVVRVKVGMENYSKNGTIWVDDISLKFDGKEALKNGSFEER